MKTVKATHPDTEYLVDLSDVQALDAEGNVVDIDESKLDVQVTSDNPAAVEVIPDEDGDNTAGKIHIGTPGVDGTPLVANLVATVTYDGAVVAVFGEQFTVVPGDVDTFTGGAMEFPNLEEVPMPEPPEEEDEEPV